MNKIIIGVLFLSIFSHSFSQQLKVYSGVYNGRKSEGKATYQYYENENYERIYNGSFLYKGVESNNWLKIEISGNYKDNKKDGTWKYHLMSDGNNNNFKTFSSDITGNFINGNLNGEWKFNRNYTITQIGFAGIVIGTTSENSYAIANFSDNHLIGNFEYSNVGEYIKGSFNKNGFLEGEWLIKWEQGNVPYEEVRRYNDGVCYKILQRNLSTGDIIVNFDNSKLIKQFFILNSSQKGFTEFEGKAYKLVISNQEKVYSTVFGDSLSIKEYSGIKKIYNAIGFWVCKDNSQCNFLMSSDPIDFKYGNYIYEIDKGINNLNESFEKTLVELEKDEILKISKDSNINTELTEKIKKENEQILKEKNKLDNEEKNRQEVQTREENNIDEFSNNIQEIRIKTNEVQTLYYKECFPFPCKKELYKAKENLSKYFSTELGSYQYSNENLEISRKYLNLLKKMLSLYNTDTKEMEGLLKDESNPIKLIEIFKL